MRFRFTLSTDQLSTSFPGLSEFENAEPGNEAWTLGATPSVTPTTSKLLRGAIGGGVQDVEYQIDFDLDVADLTGGAHNLLVRIRLYDSTFTTYVDDTTAVFFTNGNKVGSVNLTPTFAPAYVVFLALQSSGSGASVTINSYSGSAAVVMSDSLEITEPDGWKDATLKLERHPKYHSLVEHFEGDFIFYGQNQFVNGGIEYIKEKVRYFGVDVTISILIELALNDVDYQTVFTGQLAVPEQKAMVDNKLKCNVIRDDFWTKFIKRVDTPVNLQSGYSLDGESVTVLDSVSVNMTPQLLDLVYYAIEDFGILVIMNEEYIQYEPNQVILDELKHVSSLPVATNAEKPVWKFEAEYDGDLDLDLRIEYSKTESGTGHTGARTIYDYWFQLNDEAPIEFSYTSGAYVDPQVYDNWGAGVGMLPPGDNSIETTIASFTQTIALTKGDVVRIYLQRDSASDNNITFWGDQGLWANKPNPYPLQCQRPLGMQETPTYFRFTQHSQFSATNAEGFLLHDVAGLICDRIISGDDIFYSELLGSLQTLYRLYEQDGCNWHYVLMRGLQIRQYSLLEKAFFISFKQWWEGANPILNLGLGYETLDAGPADAPTVDSFANEQLLDSGTDWTINLGPLRYSCTPGLSDLSKLLAFEIFGGLADVDYHIGYNLTCSDAGAITISLYNSALTSSVSETVLFGGGGGNQTGTKILTPTFVPKYVTFRTSFGDGATVFDVEPFTFSVEGIPDPEPAEVIRVEEKAHFYDNSYTSLYIGNIRQIEWSFDGDHHFNLVRTGYNKWESESASGLDDPQTKREFNTRFKKAGQPIDLYSSFIAAGLTFEKTRRTSKEKSADYKYDNDIFILSIRPDPVEISPETSPDVIDYEPELDENFDSITGLLNPESRYNLRLTPARNLIRWLNYLSGCLYKYLISTFSFASGQGNYDMTSELTEVSPDCGDSFSEVSESGNFAVSNEPLFIPKLIEMTVPLTWEHYMTIRQYRKNPIGISQSESDYTNLFIKDLSFKPALGQATITGWPDEDFELVVPEDTFRGQVCFTYPTTEECTMLTEESETMITEDNEIMILEEC